MFDILFDATIPNVFISPFQDYPLDFHTKYFYKSRKSNIDNLISWLETCSPAELKDKVKSTVMAK